MKVFELIEYLRELDPAANVGAIHFSAVRSRIVFQPVEFVEVSKDYKDLDERGLALINLGVETMSWRYDGSGRESAE